MTRIENAFAALMALVEMGGAVVVILLVMSVVAGAIVLFKLWQYRALGVARHAGLSRALELWRAGARVEAQEALARARGLGALVREAMEGPDDRRLARRDLLYAATDIHLGRVEAGFRALDATAQLGPLLGLFGTVLGMIEAFQAMEGAGSNVDPSVLAAGIWVALLTTAVGLAVSMSSTAVLTWLESLAETERRTRDLAIETICALSPLPQGTRQERPVIALPRHA